MPFDTTFDRSQGIGASEAGTAAGLNPFRSPAKLAAEKMGLIEVEPSGDRALFGNKFEMAALELFAEKLGIPLSEFTVPDKTLTHPEHPWMFASPDALHPDFGFEIKWVGFNMAKHFGAGDEFDDNKLPPYYLAQMAWQAMVTGLKLIRLAAVIGTELRTYTYTRNEKFESKLFDRCSALWSMIQRKEMPEPNWGHADTEEVLRSMYPAETLAVRAATPEEMAKLIRMRELKAQMDQLEGEYDALKQQVMDGIGDAAGLVAEGIANPTWKKDKDSVRIDYKQALLEFQPILGKVRARQLEKLIAKHTQTKPGARKFLPRFEKDDQ